MFLIRSRKLARLFHVNNWHQSWDGSSFFSGWFFLLVVGGVHRAIRCKTSCNIRRGISIELLAVVGRNATSFVAAASLEQCRIAPPSAFAFAFAFARPSKCTVLQCLWSCRRHRETKHTYIHKQNAVAIPL